MTQLRRTAAIVSLLIGAMATTAVAQQPAPPTRPFPVAIRLESAVSSALVTFSMEGVQTTPQGWPIITNEFPAFDATKLVQRPGTDVVMFRTGAILQFLPGVTVTAKQTFFSQNGMTVLGVGSSGEYFVTIPDPGTSITEYDAYFGILRAKPEILRVLPGFYRGIKLVPDARF
jgi:hypothetical protein